MENIITRIIIQNIAIFSINNMYMFVKITLGHTFEVTTKDG